MNDPIISVIVPVYNAKKYLECCLISIIRQSIHNIQIIIINDGSTDGSDVLCDKFKSIDSRIEVIHKKNEGVGIARKIGVENATGKYVAFVDSDDFLVDNAFSILLQNNNNFTDVIIGDYNLIDEKLSIKKISRSIDSKEEYIKKLLEWGSIETVLWAKLIKRDLFEKSTISFSNGLDFGEDYAIMPRLFYFADNIVKIDKAVYNYRKGVEGSYTSSLDNKKIEDLIKANLLVSSFYEKVSNYKFYYKSIGIGKLNIRKYLCLRDKKNFQFKGLQEFYQYYPKGDRVFFKLLDYGLINLAVLYKKIYSRIK
ncbi:Glycosyltransferase involved in cell wall bisynthesis [Polaribacter sp. KT25b]|uniref:glycosyltransferase family 2 protein n=1 Tax=Polaribacter sp. KT25b TaxID=1855336 RepID=UPI00087B4879|nr:glycosyltransferase [Polaribacter sp. KT25b]SDS26697.1 Glycosyltransferase involved in cell wall bisynthesis [Polaribacter sp. KT25b]